MSTAGRIKQDLFQYFEARGLVAGHLVSIVDFTDKMNPGHSAEDLERTTAAFAELVAAGVFEAKAPDEYALTAQGLDMLRSERAHEQI